MTLFNKLKQKKHSVDMKRSQELLESTATIPDGMFEKCPSCGAIHEATLMHAQQHVCPGCNYHNRLHIAERIRLTFDTFKVFHHGVKSTDPLGFPGYPAKLKSLSESMGVYDAVVCGEATLAKHEVIAIVMDSNFLMGSMGSVVGEKITHAFERALDQKKPIVLFSASGGARMQEGIVSLMQMAKTSAALGAFSKAGGLSICVLTDPTTGGVTASFAMLTDIILAEPGALIGFAGPRVIEQTLKTPLPDGFQRAEFLKEKGFVDKVVHRFELKQTLEHLLDIHRT